MLNTGTFVRRFDKNNCQILQNFNRSSMIAFKISLVCGKKMRSNL